MTHNLNGEADPRLSIFYRPRPGLVNFFLFPKLFFPIFDGDLTDPSPALCVSSLFLAIGLAFSTGMVLPFGLPDVVFVRRANHPLGYIFFIL